MGFFDKLVPPSSKGEKNFDRAMRAELRRDFTKAEEYFTACADNFAEHFSTKEDKGGRILVRHLVMGGIACTRIGRNEQAVEWLEKSIAMRDDVPDAWLHAGYAWAKMNDAEKAVHYWSNYPQWSEERIVSSALNEIIPTLKTDAPDLPDACERVVQAFFSQMRHNHALPPQRRDAILQKRGY